MSTKDELAAHGFHFEEEEDLDLDTDETNVRRKGNEEDDLDDEDGLEEQ